MGMLSLKQPSEDRYYYHPYFTNEEIEAPIRGRTESEYKHSDFRALTAHAKRLASLIFLVLNSSLEFHIIFRGPRKEDLGNTPEMPCICLFFY